MIKEKMAFSRNAYITKVLLITFNNQSIHVKLCLKQYGNWNIKIIRKNYNIGSNYVKSYKDTSWVSHNSFRRHKSYLYEVLWSLFLLYIYMVFNKIITLN